MVVLTDACLASDFSGGLGGVLVDQSGTLKSWYRLKLSSQLVQRFMKEGQEVAIAELESLAGLLAVQLWTSGLTSRQVLFCLDNEISRFGFIKGYSHAQMVSKICNLENELCENCIAMPWFLHVPSAANLADFPSRFVDHPFLVEKLMVPCVVAENALRNVDPGLSNGVGFGA